MRDVATDQQNHALEEDLVVDRDTASRLGLTTSAIDNTLYDAFGQRLVSIMFTQLNQYHVVLEVAPEFRQNPNALSSLYVKSTTGQQVPLSAFTHFEPGTASLTAESPGPISLPPRSPSIWLQEPRWAMPCTEIENAGSDIGMPASVAASFQGTAAAFRNSLANESWLLLAAVVTVYIVLGVLYESYIHPLTILSTLPSAGVGAILALQLFHLDLGIIALIGIILLIGIVKKNAIMMIDFALEAERGRKSPSRGGHLSSLPAALPAHHDDHHGRVVWRFAAGHGPGHRFRTASSTGHQHRRRPAGQSGTDSLHHTGGVHLV